MQKKSFYCPKLCPLLFAPIEKKEACVDVCNMKTVLLDTLVKKYNPELLLSVLPTSYCLPHWIKNRAPLVIFPLGAGMVKSLKYHRLFTNSYPLFCLGKNALLPIYICSIA